MEQLHTADVAASAVRSADTRRTMRRSSLLFAPVLRTFARKAASNPALPAASIMRFHAVGCRRIDRHCCHDLGRAHVLSHPGGANAAISKLFAAVFVVVFGFLFVTVAGASAGCWAIPQSDQRHEHRNADGYLRDIFLAGWTSPKYAVLALMIGGAVCIASRLRARLRKT